MTALSLRWLRYEFWCESQAASLHRWRWHLAAAIVVFSMLDLILTQQILTVLETVVGTGKGEANPIMAPFVMTWWAWPIRVGLPCLIVARHMRGRAYNVMAFGAVLFGAVVAWNSYQWRLLDQFIS